MKISFEHPYITYTDRDEEKFFKDITMFDFHLNTGVHYFKNHDSMVEELSLSLLGFKIYFRRNFDYEESND